MMDKNNLPPTDFFVGIGLIVALILAIVFATGVELQTTIASGLVGYMGRAALESDREKGPMIIERDNCK